MPDDHAYDAYAVASQRILAALAYVDLVPIDDSSTYSDVCWTWHAGCLAARIRATLTGKDPTT